MRVDFSFLGDAFKGRPELLVGYIQSVEQEMKGSVDEMLNAIRTGNLDSFRRAHHRIKPQLESMGCEEVNKELDKMKNTFTPKYLNQINAEKKIKNTMEEIMSSLKNYEAKAQ